MSHKQGEASVICFYGCVYLVRVREPVVDTFPCCRVTDRGTLPFRLRWSVTTVLLLSFVVEASKCVRLLLLMSFRFGQLHVPTLFYLVRTDVNTHVKRSVVDGAVLTAQRMWRRRQPRVMKEILCRKTKASARRHGEFPQVSGKGCLERVSTSALLTWGNIFRASASVSHEGAPAATVDNITRRLNVRLEGDGTCRFCRNPPRYNRHYNEKTEANNEVCALCAATPKALV